MWVEDAVHCSAVGRDKAVAKTPSLAEQRLQEERVGAARFAIDGVVDAHGSLGLGELNGRLELRCEVLGEVLGGDVDVVAQARVAMPGLDVVSCVVLDDSRELGRHRADATLHRRDVLVRIQR